MIKLLETTFVYGENLLTEKREGKITDEADVLQISIDLTKKNHITKYFFLPYNIFIIFISHLVFFGV